MSEKHGVLTTNGLVVRQNIEYKYRKPSETAVFSCGNQGEGCRIRQDVV